MRCYYCKITSVEKPDGYFKVDGKWVLLKWRTNDDYVSNIACPECQYTLKDLWKTATTPMTAYYTQSKTLSRTVTEFGLILLQTRQNQLLNSQNRIRWIKRLQPRTEKGWSYW